MLEFLYTSDYTLGQSSAQQAVAAAADTTEQSTQSATSTTVKLTEVRDVKAYASYTGIIHPAYLHMRIFRVADYFQIHTLRRLATNKFFGSLSVWPSTNDLRTITEELYSTNRNYKRLKENFPITCINLYLKRAEGTMENLHLVTGTNFMQDVLRSALREIDSMRDQIEGEQPQIQQLNKRRCCRPPSARLHSSKNV